MTADAAARERLPSPRRAGGVGRRSRTAQSLRAAPGLWRSRRLHHDARRSTRPARSRTPSSHATRPLTSTRRMPSGAARGRVKSPPPATASGGEERQVGAGALGHDAASAQAEALRREAGHLADRRLERQHRLVAHVVAEDARERAVRTGVVAQVAPARVVGCGDAVGRDHDVGVREDRADVLLEHPVDDDQSVGVVLEDREHGLDGRLSALASELGERPALGPGPGREDRGEVVPAHALRGADPVGLAGLDRDAEACESPRGRRGARRTDACVAHGGSSDARSVRPAVYGYWSPVAPA